MHIFDVCQIPYRFPTLEGGWSGDLTDKAGSTLREVDEVISQIPYTAQEGGSGALH